MHRRIERKLNRRTVWVGVVTRYELGGLAAARAARLTHLATAATDGTSAASLVGAAEWHSNADVPDSRGYQNRPGDRAPWRSSDHDPLVVGFRLRKP